MRSRDPLDRPSTTARGTWPDFRARTRRTRIRTRILAGVLAVTLIALAGFGFATVTALRGYLLDRVDIDLQSVLAEYRPMISKDAAAAGSGHSAAPGKTPSRPVQGHSVIDHSPHPFRIPTVLDHYYVELVSGKDPGKELVSGDANLIPRLPSDLAAVAARGGSQTVTSRSGQDQLRLLAASSNGRILVVTTSMQSLDSTVSRLSVIVALGLLTAVIVVFAGVSLVVSRGLRPVHAMAVTADRITAGDLSIRVSPHDQVTEVGRLGAALNGMLARIHEAIREREAGEEATRQFFADASHELRTPLAALRANAELYQQGALSSRDQVDEAMHRIASEARRMGSLVDDMLRLARLDQHPERCRAPVDLSALAAECADRARAASPERVWHAHVAPGITIDGDEEMLRRAVDNLLVNAAVHTPPGTTVSIAVTPNGDGHGSDTVTIEVSDDGPGVPAAQLPRVFDRFYRVPGQARRPGSGLGLAIAAATATAHGGTAQARPNLPRGLRVTLILPRHSRTDEGSAEPSSGRSTQSASETC